MARADQNGTSIQMSETTRTDRMETFSTSQVFKRLSPSAIEEVVDAFKQRTFEPDQFIFHEGAPAHIYFVIVSGRVKIVKTSAEGHEVIMHILGPGELIGALPTLGEGSYPASAIAM
jgi:CRP-like cAMP-binding protein